MGWIGWVCCKIFWCDFVARTFALIAQVQPILHRVSCSNETIQMHPNATKRTNTCIKGPMGWIGCVHCEKFRCDFMAQTCALIAPVQPILHRVSCSKERLPNAPKWYEMHQNMSLGSNGVDRVSSLRKILTRLRGTNFSTISARFAPSFVRQPNGPECTQKVRNAPKR